MEICLEDCRKGGKKKKGKNIFERTGLDIMLGVFCIGAHMRGLGLNHILQELGATFGREARTAPDYELYDLDGKRPGMLRVKAGGGHVVVGEVWNIPLDKWGDFMSKLAAPLSIGWVHLNDNTTVLGFLVESADTTDKKNISEHGGWRAYKGLQ